MKIFLAGATGVIGRPLTAQLLAAGHQVFAMSRSEQGAAELRQLGATPVVCDVFDWGNLRRCLGEIRPEVVINQLTALPKRIDPRKIKTQLAATNRVRIEGTNNLFDAALAAGAKRFISQSIAFVYNPRGTGLNTEESPLHQSPTASFAEVVEAVRLLEATTLSSSELPGIVLRYGFFYGPGTVYAKGGAMADDVRHRRTPIIGGGTGEFPFIHVEDAAAATVAAVWRGEPGAYNIVDDEPASVAVWLPAYAKALGAPPPRRVPRWLARLLVGSYATYLMCDQRGALNDKAKRELDWLPRYSTWRMGFERIINDHSRKNSAANGVLVA